VKIKIGESWVTCEVRDPERMRLARKVIGDQAELYVDANGAYTAKQAAMAGLQDFADTEGLDAASFTGIGAFSSPTVAYFDPDGRRYLDIPVDEQVEVLNLIGEVTRTPDGGRQVHAHVVLGRRDGSTRGGHLQRDTVRPTLEVVVTETPAHLARGYDEASGLPLIDLNAPSDRGSE